MRGGGLTPLQIYSRCILQPQLTGLLVIWFNSISIIVNYLIPNLIYGLIYDVFNE